MKNLKVIILFVVGIPLIVWSASLNRLPLQKRTVEIEVYTIDPNYVQPPAEAQSRLKDQGFYTGSIDGIWGPETDKAFCNWSAVQEFKRVEEKQGH